MSNRVYIGSLALGVATKNSDVDYCIMKEDIVHDLIGKREYLGPYYDSILMRHSTLWKGNGTDVFVFTDRKKFNIVKKVMDQMRYVPKFILKVKYIRVKIFRALLRLNGYLK